MDPIAAAPAGRWHDGDVAVVRHAGVARLAATRSPRRLTVRHALRPADLSDRLAVRIVDELQLHRPSDFERVMVGLIRSTVADPVAAWTTFYRNSLDELLSGAAPFAPVHAQAESLVVGETMLDLGSCFGFFALRMARAGVSVTASDICGSTMRLLDRIARELDCPVTTLACSADTVPLPDRSVDTVSAIHLLEHVDASLGAAIVREAVRVARRRVVIAVPFETVATACHGHVRTFDLDDLRALGESTGLPFAVSEHHGGWLVIDR